MTIRRGPDPESENKTGQKHISIIGSFRVLQKNRTIGQSENKSEHKRGRLIQFKELAYELQGLVNLKSTEQVGRLETRIQVDVATRVQDLQAETQAGFLQS